MSSCLNSCGRLGKGVPRAGREARGHDEVAGALRRRVGQRRGLDLEEVPLVEDGARRPVEPRAEHHRLALGRTAQVEVAVLEARLLPHGYVLVDGERQGRRRVEDDDVLGDDLDLPGREVRVGASLRAEPHVSRHLEHVLGAQLVRDLLADDHLREPGGVPQVDERHPAVVAAAADPPGEGDGRARVGRAKVACEVRAVHGYSLNRGWSGSSLAAFDPRPAVVRGRLPRGRIGGGLVARADVLHLVGIAREPHERDAAPVRVLDLFAELRRGRARPRTGCRAREARGRRRWIPRATPRRRRRRGRPTVRAASRPRGRRTRSD